MLSRVLLLSSFILFFSCSEEKRSVNTAASPTKESKPDVAEISTDSSDALVSQKISSIPLPESLTFAGEPVPLDMPDVRERLERELLSNTYRHSRTVLILKRLKRWRTFVEEILEENDVHKDFIYMAIAESELNNNARSPARAMGMWQFMKGTAKQYGLEVTKQVDQRKDPKLATETACKYLKDSYETFENWTMVAASYNMGKTGLRKKLERQKVDSYYDLYLYDETSRYVFRILAFKIICENPQDYGFLMEDDNMYEPLDFYEMEVKEDIEDLNDFAIERGTNYKMLRQYNPWLNDSKDYKLEVPKKGSYMMRIPADADSTTVAQDTIPD